MLKAVIFDIDGTLIDSAELHAQAWHRAFQHFERDVPIEEIRLQIDSDEAVAVGDTPYDAEAANAIHVRTIGITGGFWTEDKLRLAGCVEVFGSPADLLERYEHSALCEARAA